MGLLDTLRGLFGGGRPAADGAFGVPGITDMPTASDLPTRTEGERVLAQIVREAITDNGWQAKLSASARWKALKDDPGELQLAVLEAVLPAPKGRAVQSFGGNSWGVREARRQIVSQLLRRDLPFPPDRLAELLGYATAHVHSLQYCEVPVLPLLTAVERHVAAHGMPDAIRRKLKALHDRIDRHRAPKFDLGVANRVTALLDPAAAAAAGAISPGAFADLFHGTLERMASDERAYWEALAAHTVKAGDKSAPTAKWFDAASPLLAAIGPDRFGAQLAQWLGAITPDPQHPDGSLDALKGMVWLAPVAASDGLAGAVGRFAETCFRKVRGVGARSVKLGNAALYALSEMAEDPQAGAELFRLRGVIKYPSARATLDKRIAELAENSGVGIAALEDAALPDFGLADDGTLREEFGGAAATLSLLATETAVQWSSAEGKPVKSVPAAVKRDHKEDLAEFVQLAKDIEKARAGQARRLEDGWLESRSWSLGDWRQHYLAHGLRRQVVGSLIWKAVDGDRSVAFLPQGGELHDLAGQPVALPDDARVTLWHPLDADPADVLAWRARIVELGLTQPIKQAHREIYVVTDAELATETYSNRFAAHILRQHQFRALCQARDWRFEFLGGWDNWNVPHREVPARGLRVEYSVEPIEDGRHSDAYVPLHLATDQVRFVGADGQAIPLIDMDAVVFSELMRDVDLFVAVTSVAADPTWQDGGPEGRFGTYWQTWAFGDLGQSALTRKDLIAQIAPRLSIADKLTIGEKALLVRGKRHEYAIHFGSTNIQIMPENRYLCIVPDHGTREVDTIRLPFAGDSQLSTILAKAFMLVDESRIKDPTILRQL